MMNFRNLAVRVGSLMLGLALVCSVAFAQTPAIAASGTVNAADYSRSFAPGAIISIFGTNLSAASLAAPQIVLPTTLGGTSVELSATGQQIPLLFVSPGQVNAQLPYTVSAGSLQIRVRSAAGVSANDTITVSARAPKIFTINFSGSGGSVATDSNNAVLTSANPAVPARAISVWMNSLGATSGSPVAGSAAPAGAVVSDTVTASVGGAPATVTFAGLQTGTTGLYRVDIQSPFVVLTGPIAVTVSVGGVSTQASTTLQYRQSGFFYTLLGGKFVNQVRNAKSGAGTTVVYRTTDAATWGANGLNAWTTTTPLSGAQYTSAAGVALTLMSGASVAYDNNGIESGLNGGFYNNLGGGSDSLKAGLTDLYSNSNYFPLVFAGYFKLAASTTVTQLIGYFDVGASDVINALPLDPANPYLKYRMNIWSNAAAGTPKETGNFVGDVFTTDTAAGTFEYSATGSPMISASIGNAARYIYRLTFTPSSAVTLPAGDYWFAPSMAIRTTPAANSTAAAPVVSTSELLQMLRRPAPASRGSRQPSSFSLMGTQMTMDDSPSLPYPVVVRPGWNDQQ